MVRCPFTHMGEDNATWEQMWKFAILTKMKYQYVLNYRAEDMKGRVENIFC